MADFPTTSKSFTLKSLQNFKIHQNPPIRGFCKIMKHNFLENSIFSEHLKDFHSKIVDKKYKNKNAWGRLAPHHWLHCFLFSPLSIFKCFFKTSAREDAKSHWLHLFDFSPLCVIKCVLKLSAREDA